MQLLWIQVAYMHEELRYYYHRFSYTGILKHISSTRACDHVYQYTYILYIMTEIRD